MKPRAGAGLPVIGPLTSGHAPQLEAFFLHLAASGDDRWFHPFPLDRSTAVRLASYAGADRYLVATADGAVVAFGMLRGWDEGFDVPSLGVAVEPEMQGQGVGRAMMAALHREAALAGATRIRLRVSVDNAKAVALYESLGYRFGEPNDGDMIGFLELDDG